MWDPSAALRGAVYSFVATYLFAFSAPNARAQEMFFRGGHANPSVEQYLMEAGPDAKLVKHGRLLIDGHSLNCGKRPTVLNDNFHSWGGAYPGFLILNTRKIKRASTAVKLYVYNHECGHQFVGHNESEADFFAIRRGLKSGWLDAVGMEKICAFISTLRGNDMYPSGAQRCASMRTYYQKIIRSSGTRTKR